MLGNNSKSDNKHFAFSSTLINPSYKNYVDFFYRAFPDNVLSPLYSFFNPASRSRKSKNPFSQSVSKSLSYFFNPPVWDKFLAKSVKAYFSLDLSGKTPRSYNPMLLKANSILREYHIYDPVFRTQQVNAVRECKDKYLQGFTDDDGFHLGVNNKVIVLRELSGSDEIVKIPYYTRFDKGYISKQLLKLKTYFKQPAVRDSKFGIFLTLTLDPSLFGSVDQGYKEGQKRLNKILTMLRRDNPNLSYVAIKEVQELNTHNIHWHGMLTGLDGSWLKYEHKIDKKFKKTGKYSKKSPIAMFRDRIAAYWNIGFIKVEKVVNRDKTGLYRYMAKYLQKTLEQGEGETTIILWALRIRAFSGTRVNLITSMNYSNKNIKTYEFMGAFDVNSVYDWDKIATWNDYMREIHEYK